MHASRQSETQEAQGLQSLGFFVHSTDFTIALDYDTRTADAIPSMIQ